MSTERRLNVTDVLPLQEGHKYPLRLRDDLYKWIVDNTTGSRNSVLNLLINVGINNIEGILEHDSLYETINNSDYAKR